MLDACALCLPYYTRGGPSERRPEDPQQPFNEPMAALRMLLAYPTLAVYVREEAGE